jgi:spore coat protein CotH
MNRFFVMGMFATACAWGQTTLTDAAAVFFDDTAVRDVRLYFDDPNWYNTLLAGHRTTADPYFPCRFRSGDVSIEKIGCRFKGNSSFQRNGIKKPFKLDFNEYDDDANFLGLKKLNLNNFDLQPDFMREKLLHDMAGRYIAALRSVYVRLYVNDAFYGLYLAVEQPDKTMMVSRFGPQEDGNLYEAEERMGGSRPNLAYLGANQPAYESVYILKTNETENDFSGLIEFLDVLNNTPTAGLPAKLEPIADVPNWLTAMALNNLVVNLDSYLGAGAEYYLYDRTLDGKFIHIQWDHNESFGITGDGTPRIANPFVTDPFWLPTAATGGGPGGGGGAANNARPLLEKLWAVDTYKRAYLRVLARLLRDGFNPEAMRARVTQLAGLIREHVNADPNKAYTMAQFETALNTQVPGGNLTIYGINQFVHQRHAYLRAYLNGQAQPGDIRLNELVTQNNSEFKDEAGDADPWIELHNLGPGPMALSGYYLTDDPANPTKWQVPARTLADGEYLLIWLDGETSEGEAHASFRAPASGKLYLFATAVSSQTPIDTVTYSAVAAGQSFARQGDYYGDEWLAVQEPTPGKANKTAAATTGGAATGAAQLVINELMADNDTIFQDPDESGAFEDWFEVYNPNAEAVDMSGMYITDNLNNPTKWQVPQGVTIPGRGYLVFMADGEPAQGPRHTSWSLSADGESLTIYAADGATLIDSVTFGPQQTDIAFGRTPDGGATLTQLRTATPGAANSGAR